MSDVQTVLASLRRPRLLVRAARLGVAEYSRARDLRRLMRRPHLPPPAQALRSLIAEEEALEETRRAGDAAYSLTRHIEILIAMIAEARLAAAAAPEP